MAPSNTSQPNVTKNPTPDSRETENTLERLRALQRQNQPPTARPNPQQGGAPQTGGNPKGDITASLNVGQQGAIADQLRDGWTIDASGLGVDKMSVVLTLTLDTTGAIREAKVNPEDQAKMSDPRYRAFAERAVRAALSPKVGVLKMPKDKLFNGATLQIRFRP